MWPASPPYTRPRVLYARQSVGFLLFADAPGWLRWKDCGCDEALTGMRRGFVSPLSGCDSFNIPKFVPGVNCQKNRMVTDPTWIFQYTSPPISQNISGDNPNIHERGDPGSFELGTYVEPMLGQGRRRWPNIGSILVFRRSHVIMKIYCDNLWCWYDVDMASLVTCTWYALSVHVLEDTITIICL